MRWRREPLLSLCWRAVLLPLLLMGVGWGGAGMKRPGQPWLGGGGCFLPFVTQSVNRFIDPDHKNLPTGDKMFTRCVNVYWVIYSLFAEFLKLTFSPMLFFKLKSKQCFPSQAVHRNATPRDICKKKYNHHELNFTSEHSFVKRWKWNNRWIRTRGRNRERPMYVYCISSSLEIMQ